MLTITIIDINPQRLMEADTIARSVLKKTGVRGTIIPVCDKLEISRNGLLALVPLLKIDGKVISTGQIITDDMIRNAIQRSS